MVEPIEECEPLGIYVEIGHKAGGAAEETSTISFGRTIRFADKTEYYIKVTNNRSQKVAFSVSVDGRKEFPTPILVRKKSAREVRGFGRRETVERNYLNDDATMMRDSFPSWRQPPIS